MGRHLRAYAPLAALILLAAGCGESGTEGKLRFADESSGGDGLVLPLAKGRAVTYTIRRATFMAPKVEVTGAHSSNDEVFEVTHAGGSTVTVHALGEGEATLTVSTADFEDQMPLEVRAEATAWLLADTSQSQGVAALDAAGAYGVAPGDELAFNAPVYVDAEGNRLSGAGPVGFGETTTTGTMKVEAGSDSLKITGGEDGDTATVEAPGGGSLRLKTAEAFEAKSMSAALYSFLFTKTLQSGPTFNVSQGVHLLRFLPVDQDGYAFIGSHALDMTVEVSEGNVLQLDPMRGEGGDRDFCVEQASDSDVCVKWQGLPAGAFRLTVGKEVTKTSQVTVTFGSVSKTYSFVPTGAAEEGGGED